MELKDVASRITANTEHPTLIANSIDFAPITGHVVIVEDDPLMQSILVELFTELGADCTPFETADEALFYLMDAKPDCALLVTDFTLPGQLNGKELALMVHQRWPGIPIIVATGYGSEVGGDLPPQISFLQKPWSMERMVETVRFVMS